MMSWSFLLKIATTLGFISVRFLFSAVPAVSEEPAGDLVAFSNDAFRLPVSEGVHRTLRKSKSALNPPPLGPSVCPWVPINRPFEVNLENGQDVRTSASRRWTETVSPLLLTKKPSLKWS